MPSAVALLAKILGHKLVRHLIIEGLETAAKRTDNTIDNKVVRIVKHGLANRADPIKRGGV